MRDCGGEGMFCELPACYPISWRGYVFVLWVENCTCLLSKTEATSGNDKTLENGHRRKVKGDTHMWLPASGNAIFVSVTGHVTILLHSVKQKFAKQTEVFEEILLRSGSFRWF